MRIEHPERNTHSKWTGIENHFPSSISVSVECGVLATISFAAWETIQFGVDFIWPVAEWEESCFNPIGLYRLCCCCCCCCFFFSAQDKHIYKMGRQPMYTFWYSHMYLYINLCITARYFGFFLYVNRFFSSCVRVFVFTVQFTIAQAFEGQWISYWKCVHFISMCHTLMAFAIRLE